MADRSANSKLSSAQLRKIKKPVIEKKRRERINECLNQLKTLVLDALNKDESRYNKMEKADILEMTVRHIKTNSRQTSPVPTSPVDSLELVGKYRSGFSECAHEVSRCLGDMDGLAQETRQRLMLHLNGCLQNRLPSAAVAVSPAQVTVQPQVFLPQRHATQQQQTAVASPIPSATQLAALPGASAAVPLALQSRVILVSPQMLTSPTQQSPQQHQSPVSVNNAIPLYVSTSGQSSPSHCVQASPATNCTYMDSRCFNNSPILGDEAPNHFQDGHKIHATIIASPKMPTATNTAARFGYHTESVIVKPKAKILRVESTPTCRVAVECADQSMWRPW